LYEVIEELKLLLHSFSPDDPLKEVFGDATLPSEKGSEKWKPGLNLRQKLPG
jgi:hypothetical protein